MLLKIEINFLNIPIPPIIFFSWKFYGEVKKESIFKTIEFSQNVVYKYVSCFSRIHTLHICSTISKHETGNMINCKCFMKIIIYNANLLKLV